MRLPRDLSGRELAVLLGRHLGYEPVRQSGSHLRLKTTLGGEHHLTIPLGGPLRVGTLASILSEVAGHAGLSRTELEERLFT